MPCIKGKIYLFRTNDSLGSVTPAANKLGRKSRKKRKERKSRKFRQESSILVTLFGTERRKSLLHCIMIEVPGGKDLGKVQYEKL